MTPARLVPLQNGTFFGFLLFIGCSVCTASVCRGQNRLDEPPIDYLKTRGDNPVSRLAEKVNSGDVTLRYEEGSGQLRSILKELSVPVSSQTLVFSKTSLQAGRISPDNPRAIYFNDDVYVGWVRGSPLLEIATADPHLGTAFYTISMYPPQPRIRRENNRCLACHEAFTEQGKAPLHMVRSVMTRRSGKVNLLLDEFDTDHTSPLSQRWGGWYVTGSTGGVGHMGNSFLEGEQLVPAGALEREELSGDFQTSRWPTPYSDVVALMVMEHQAQLHNHFTRAEYAVRRARFAHADESISDAEWKREIERAADLVVESLLFVGEAPLEQPITPSNRFVDDFAASGRRDAEGRSLRDFDLSTRLFRYPCSYLIGSSSFHALDSELRDLIYRKLLAVLSGRDRSDRFEHLSASDRAAILEILRDTQPNLPPDWRDSAAAAQP